MQGRVVALGAAAAFVLAAIVVLSIKVRAAAEPALSDEAVKQAMVGYQRSQLGRSAEPGAGSGGRAPSISRPPPEASERRPVPSLGEVSRPRRSTGDRPWSPQSPGPARDGAGSSTGLPPDASPELVAKREAAREAYDHGDYESALSSAEEFLKAKPDDAYIKRIAAVSACATGDEAAARRHFQETTPDNQRIVALRCRRYGVEL
ncbi:MAG TPA: hypothetical protein VKB80_05350 [Kofleriaceae bacterium]|nr:hypothetical protein [Kofleriaceae bacterium]